MKFIERFSRQPSRQVQPVDPGAAPLLMALEPRIMFDAVSYTHLTLPTKA